MKKFFQIALVVLPTSMWAQFTETRSVDAFTGVSCSSLMNIVIVEGSPCALTLEGKEDDVKGAKASVKNGVLELSDGGTKSSPIKAKVTVSKLQYLEMGGPAVLTTEGQVMVDSVMIKGEGASNMTMELKGGKVYVDLQGASNLKLTGGADYMQADLKGAGILSAGKLEVQHVVINASGASNAGVKAVKSIKAEASGASYVKLYGEPENKILKVNGVASIEDTGKSNDSDTTRVNIAGKNIEIVDKDDERSDREKKADDDDFEFWGGLDLGVNGLMTYDRQVAMPDGLKYMDLNYTKSYVFGWNIMQKNVHIYKNYVNLGTGLGLTWYHYNLRNSYSLQPNLNYTTAVFDSLDYSRNRLNVCYVNVPLFLEFNTNNSNADRSFHFGAGAQFGYNVFKNKLKQKYELDGETYKRKIKDDFNVNPFKMDLITRIGYGDFTLFASYSLTTLFEKDKGPRLYPFTAGVHLDF